MIFNVHRTKLSRNNFKFDVIGVGKLVILCSPYQHMSGVRRRGVPILLIVAILLRATSDRDRLFCALQPKENTHELLKFKTLVSYC